MNNHLLFTAPLRRPVRSGKLLLVVRKLLYHEKIGLSRKKFANGNNPCGKGFVGKNSIFFGFVLTNENKTHIIQLCFRARCNSSPAVMSYFGYESESFTADLGVIPEPTVQSG